MSHSARYSSRDLLHAARAVLVRRDAASEGVWPRAAAHLCRQALESGLDEFWTRRAPGVENLPVRAQLLCLPAYLNDATLARTISYTWGALSNACHHHIYELAPTAAELAHWVDTVEAMLELEGFDRHEFD